MPDSFVDVVPLVEAERVPELNPELLNNTNRMRLHVFANDAKGHAVLVAVYDNLGKGASGGGAEPQPDAGRRRGHLARRIEAML